MGKILVALFCVFAFGCMGSLKAEEHADKGPHGGAILETGDEVAHIEFIRDAKAGTVTLYILGPDAKTALVLKDAPKLNLKTDKGNAQVETKAVEAKDGAASQYTATSDDLKSEHVNGRVALTVNGKQYNVKIDDGHKH